METITNVISFLPALIKATPLTLLLTATAGIFGLIIGTLAALARLSRHRLLAWPAFAFTFAFRGTPLLVQIYLIYYGLGQILPEPGFGIVSYGPICGTACGTRSRH
ncbi:ABC transporter permease subunit [Rhizobium grahamii]|uniref:ABC transporter permease subunit n=1 Tax=Rhizobium grahamii TaxID=1120045 RepID=UPI001FEFA325|nr:ABC transporter permease subunit [Rhizobium grahamii]